MKILLIAEPGSAHTAGFHNVLKALQHEVRIFAMSEFFQIYTELNTPLIYADSYNHHTKNLKTDLLFRRDYNLLERQFFRLLSRFARRSSRFKQYSNFRKRGLHLKELINDWKPELVITLKLQNEGYFYSYFLSRYPDFSDTPWIHFLWGTDLEFFGKNSGTRNEHRPVIEKTLGRCPFILTDTLRDVEEARKFGFQGEVLGTLVAFGGIESNLILGRRNDQVKRNRVVIKGREGGLVGRAGLVIRTIAGMPDVRLNEFEFHLIMPTESAKRIVNECNFVSGRSIIVHDYLSHAEVIDLMSKSEISISASDVDGTPGFLIESMAYGAIPIHSDMESIREWIADGVNGFLFENNLASLEKSIARALDASQSWEEMAQVNSEVVRDQASRDFVTQKLGELLNRFEQKSFKPNTVEKHQ